MVTFRLATVDDCALLAQLNQQLIQDEANRNCMTLPELEHQMKNSSAEFFTSDHGTATLALGA
jgi:hypothetical protein